MGEVRADQADAGRDERGEPVLEVEGLTVGLGGLELITELAFALGAGERVGLIGESGSGKSLTALALIGLLPEGLRARGSVRLAGVGHDLIGASERRMSAVRGRRMAMVFQEPMTALNPLMKVGRQVAEILLLHDTEPDRESAREAVVELFERVHLSDPERMPESYPHQLSGGERQRVMLAMALANEPTVLICDEPTTALDVTVQARMLEVILEGVERHDSALLFITHDLPVVATVCRRVMVLYGGRLVESGPIAEVFTRPRHPYTEGLLESSKFEESDADGRLPTIPGSVPAAGRFPSGCPFRDRCHAASERCTEWPGWTGDALRGFACWHPRGGDDG
ncbi:MAG: ABC transporter ATP-binding protein [Egibacteraceae bacterium]